MGWQQPWETRLLIAFLRFCKISSSKQSQETIQTYTFMRNFSLLLSENMQQICTMTILLVRVHQPCQRKADRLALLVLENPSLKG